MVKTKHATTAKPCSFSLGKLAPLKHQLIELFWVIGPAFTRWAESHMHERGLTPQRVRLLGFLKENGPVMMSKLSERLGVTATNITALVDALEKDGMVARDAHPTDRRATMISLTPKAHKSLTENCADFKDKVSEIFSDFTKAQQEDFLSYLIRTKEALTTRNVIAHDDVDADEPSVKKTTLKRRSSL